MFFLSLIPFGQFWKVGEELLLSMTSFLGEPFLPLALKRPHWLILFTYFCPERPVFIKFSLKLEYMCPQMMPSKWHD